MIDPADKQTKQLPLEQKRGRGRPSTGQAMTPAEKQRAYRQRLAEQSKNQVPAVQLEKVRSTASEYFEKLGQQLADAKSETAAAIARAEQAEADFVTLRKKLDKALATIQEMKKGNVTEITSGSRLNEGMRKLIQDVHDVADALDGSVFRIQRKKGLKGKWSTLKGSYWQEAKAQDALLDLPKCEGAVYRIIETKSDLGDDD